MPIPPLNDDGLLPPGIHEATIEEVQEVFGRGGTRTRLLARLREFLAELQQWQMSDVLLINGSFVTDKPNPNDIDLMLVLQPDYDLSRDVSPFEYNLRSHKMVKKKFGFDLFAVRPASVRYETLLDLFSQVRDRPGSAKGIVRIIP